MWLRIIVGNHALPANQQNREPSLALCNFDDWPKFGLNISDINGSCLRSTLESTPAHAAQRIVQQPSMRCSEASQSAQLVLLEGACQYSPKPMSSRLSDAARM
jgi:hypothetical protein